MTLDDAADLNRLLYNPPGVLREWCAEPTLTLAREAAGYVVARLRHQRTVRVVDYGAGTGAAAVALVRAVRVLDDSAIDEGRVRITSVDLPGPWFNSKALTEVFPAAYHDTASLRSDEGTILGLDVATGAAADVVLSSMVFHLVPRRALTMAVSGIAAALSPGGLLLWTAPDLAPATDGALLFHDANRLIRTRFETLAGLGTRGRDQAAKQIPNPPLSAGLVAEAVVASFGAGCDMWPIQTWIEYPDVVRAALLGPNLANLHETGATDGRIAMCDRLLEEAVLPQLFDGRRDSGRALQWYSGRAAKSKSC